MVVNVRKAHWNAAARRTIYIKLPEEDDEPGMCGLCLKSLYGFLDAASCWSNEVTDMLTENRFHVGKASPALFRHDSEEIKGLVHGDDFVTLSDDRARNENPDRTRHRSCHGPSELQVRDSTSSRCAQDPKVDYVLSLATVSDYRSGCYQSST